MTFNRELSERARHEWAAPAAATEGADYPTPRFWDWFTGNVNYPEWSKLDASAIAAMYCAWVAGQDSARPAPAAALAGWEG